MEDQTNINSGAVIMNTNAKFIIKKGSGAAANLLVITGNHMSIPGKTLRQVTNALKEQLDVNHEYDKDVIVEEEVWLGSQVVLLAGTIIRRGCIVGAGTVVRGSKVPPYAIIAGNPAKVIGFRFTPQEIVEHEKAIYQEDERLPIEVLEKNYNKYFVKRIKEIKEFTKL